MDAMTGRGELGDQGLVAALYGWGGRAGTKAWTGRTGADWGGRGGLADWRMGRTTESWTGRTGADGAGWGGRGGWGGLGRTGGRGGGRRIGLSLEGRKGRTRDYSGEAIPLLSVLRGFQEC